MVEVEIQHIALSRDPADNRYLLLRAKDQTDERVCPIMIGYFEANAIISPARDPHPKRPMTHDLLLNIIQELGATVAHVYIHKLDQGTFFADVALNVGEEQRDIDARPSDAIAIAIRTRAPIYVADEVLEEVNQARNPEEPREDEPEERHHGHRRDDASTKPVTAEERERMSAFSDLVDSLSLDESEGEGTPTK